MKILQIAISISAGSFENTATKGRAIYKYSHGTVDATYNWWGTNLGPSSAYLYGTPTVSPWLVLNITANPKSIPNNSKSNITADLLKDNNGDTVTGYLPDMMVVTFSSSLGTISSPASTINNVAKSTLTSGSKAGISTVSAKLDDQTVNTSVTVTDTIPPTVKTITPLKNAVNVPTNQVIKLTFSEPIKAGNMWIELKNSAGTIVPITKTIVGNVLTIKHTSTLTKGRYTLALHTGSITDITGNPLAYYGTSFTVDSIPPKVISTTPTNLKTVVSRISTIIIKFSENFKSSTYYNNITVKNLKTGKYVTIKKSISGNTLYLKTNSTRSAYTWYLVTIPKSSIKDYAGNNLQANYTFKFKTGP